MAGTSVHDLQELALGLAGRRVWRGSDKADFSLASRWRLMGRAHLKR
jgi:hypothetical protein